MPKALRPILVSPDTYQVILLAFGRVLGVPLLLAGSLLKIVVAVVVVVTRVVASAPASPSGSKLLWHKWGKGTKDSVRNGEKELPDFCSNPFLVENRQPSSGPSAGQRVSSSSLEPIQRTTWHKALPTDPAGVKVREGNYEARSPKRLSR